VYRSGNGAERTRRLNRSAELAEESLRLIILRYRNGESTVLEVADAQTTFALTMRLIKMVPCVIGWRWQVCKLLRGC